MDTVIAVLIRVLETIFMVGLAGSTIVLILTLIEDAKSLLPGGEKKESEAKPARSGQPQLHASDTLA